MSQLRNEIDRSIERIREAPKLVQWGMIGALLLMLFLVWDGYIAETAKRWNDRADQIQREIDTVRNAHEIALQVQRLSDTIVGVGEIHLPRTPAEGESSLIAAVNEVLNSHNVSNHNYQLRSRSTMPRGAMQELTGGQQAERLPAVLRFEAAPDDAIAIIAALEARPEIEAITTLQMTRSSGRRVSVYLTLEAWVIPGGVRATRAGV